MPKLARNEEKSVESAAREALAFHPSLVLGLLQTEAYAHALYRPAQPIEETTTEFINKNVRLRLRRKEALTRTEEPLTTGTRRTT
ncbi:Scr1 family TA system antitoxin-like transcriptional regulator [Streptomyces uncialis]|uniref:Scr1 family TA system antitoxin-like transcriptional regulator n=1 Tax=Streptomyces uncialis TaxID=1048205 RepID=UPI00378E6585